MSTINICMTSYPLRINNCVPVIQAALANTHRPDCIYLSLSTQEFPNRLSDLPQKLMDLCSKNKEVKINWVEGPNTKSMKKVFPMLKYVDDDDILMTLDDDHLLMKGHIQSRLDDFNRYGGTVAITTRSNIMCSNNLFTKRMLKNFDLFWTDQIIQTYHDDQFYNKILYLNGYRFVKASGFLLNQMPQYNPVNGMTRTHAYLPGIEFHQMFTKLAEQVFGRKWEDLFGIFNKVNIDDYRDKLKRSETCPL